MKIELIDNWKQFYKLFSFWAFVLLGLTPELFDLATEFGLIESEAAPAALANVIKIIAFGGAVLRLVKQRAAEAAAENSSTA